MMTVEQQNAQGLLDVWAKDAGFADWREAKRAGKRYSGDVMPWLLKIIAELPKQKRQTIEAAAWSIAKRVDPHDPEILRRDRERLQIGEYRPRREAAS